MARHTLIREIKDCVELHRCPRTGIAWVEDGKTGNGYSAHPHIDSDGSVTGMKSLGHWKKSDRTLKTHGCIYNIDKVVINHEFDQVAANECQCEACSEQRAYEQEHQKVNVLDLAEGDMVDMARCPYLKNHPMAEFVYAEVCYVLNESLLAAVGYEGVDEVGYDKEQELWVKKGTP